REQAQSLLYLLVGSLPEEQRRPYLGDVQIEQEVEGVRRAVLRRQGVRRSVPTPSPANREGATVGDVRPGQAPPARGVEHLVVEAAPPAVQAEQPSPLLNALRSLIAS